MKPMLEISNLSVRYARTGEVLNDLCIEVGSGDIVALLGANGAGKTTLIRTISGLLSFHGGSVLRGEVHIDGESVLGLAPHTLVRMGLGQVPEGRMVFKQLSVDENLRVGASHLPRAQLLERLLAIFELFPRLKERQGQAAGWLSGGEQQMLALGRALIGNPKMLLVDELSLGLAPQIVRTIYQRLQEVGRLMGTSILVVEQNAMLALQFASHAYVIDRGRITYSGTAIELASSTAIRESYLGSDAIRSDRVVSA